MSKNLYVMLHPYAALIGSQLDPQDFAKHVTNTTARHYKGKIIFASVDSSFRHSYFPIDTILKELIPHEDGRPKATKFIKTYRVLEHLDLSKLQNMYLVQGKGHAIMLEKDYGIVSKKSSGNMNLFLEIWPMRMLTVSKLAFKAFGQYMNDPHQYKGAPTICYTQLQFDMEALLNGDDTIKKTIPNIEIERLKNVVTKLKQSENVSKGILLEAHLNAISYKNIKHGIALCSKEQLAFFKMPSLEEIKLQNEKFYEMM